LADEQWQEEVKLLCNAGVPVLRVTPQDETIPELTWESCGSPIIDPEARKSAGVTSYDRGGTYIFCWNVSVHSCVQ